MFFFALLFFLSPQGSPPPDLFASRCAGCHGDTARGTAKAPGLAMNPRVAGQSAEELSAYLAHGNPGAGMPGFAAVSDKDRLSLAHYLRHINNDMIVAPRTTPPPRKTNWAEPGPGDWVTYNGHESANRYSALKQITTANVSSLKLKWVFPIAHFGLEVTPLAAEGVMYVTGPNQVFALDALTGSPIWHYSRPQTPTVISDASLGTNRGVALLRDKVYFITDNAHLLALDRATGSLL